MTDEQTVGQMDKAIPLWYFALLVLHKKLIFRRVMTETHHFPNAMKKSCSDSLFYGGIIRTNIVLLFISCARLFLFRRSFFLFYYLVRTTFLFRRSFFSFLLSRAHDFFTLYVVFSFLLSRAHDFFFAGSFFSFLLSREHDFFPYYPTLSGPCHTVANWDYEFTTSTEYNLQKDLRVCSKFLWSRHERDICASSL